MSCSNASGFFIWIASKGQPLAVEEVSTHEALGLAALGHGLLMGLKTKAWHDGENQEQDKVDGA